MRRFVHPANQTFARKSWKTRWFVLAGSVIKYYKEEVHFLAGGAKPLGMLQLDSDTVVKVSIGTFSYRIFYISAGMWYSRKRVKMPPCSQAKLVLTFSLSLYKLSVGAVHAYTFNTTYVRDCRETRKTTWPFQ